MQQGAGADSAPVLRLEAAAVAAVFTPLPIAASIVYALYVTLRTEGAVSGVTPMLFAAIVGLGLLGALAGWMCAHAAGPTRAPLAVGFTTALSVYGGVVIGLMLGRVSLHSTTAAFVVTYLGGAIVGPLILVLLYRWSGAVELSPGDVPVSGAGLRAALRWAAAALLVVTLGFGEFAVYDRNLRWVSTSAEQARERGILVHDYAMRPKVVVAESPRSQYGAYVRVEEAWVEQVRRGRFLRSPEVTSDRRMVLRIRPVDDRVYLYVLGADGKPVYLGRAQGRQESDSTLLTTTLRQVPEGALKFLTVEEARAMR